MGGARPTRKQRTPASDVGVSGPPWARHNTKAQLSRSQQADDKDKSRWGHQLRQTESGHEIANRLRLHDRQMATFNAL